MTQYRVVPEPSTNTLGMSITIYTIRKGNDPPAAESRDREVANFVCDKLNERER
jgi:hypothetical protein